MLAHMLDHAMDILEETYMPVDDLKIAANLFCLCVKLCSVEKILSEKPHQAVEVLDAPESEAPVQA